jgi:hypothetical protein
MEIWENKYLKYKSKYLNLKKLLGGFDNFTDEIREINKDSTLNYDYLIKYFITNYDCISRAILFLDIQSEELGTDVCFNYTFTAIDSFLESRCYATVKLFNYIFDVPYSTFGYDTIENKVYKEAEKRIFFFLCYFWRTTT